MEVNPYQSPKFEAETPEPAEPFRYRPSWLEMLVIVMIVFVLIGLCIPATQSNHLHRPLRHRIAPPAAIQE